MAHELVKLILQKKHATDTVGTITLRVKVPGSDKYIKKAVNYRIPEEFWDKATGQVKRGYPNYLHINNQIKTQKEELEATFITDTTNKRTLTVTAISARLKNEQPDSYVLTFAQQHILRLQKRGFSPGYIRDWNSKFISKFEAYGYQDVHFADITKLWLQDYEDKLRETLKHNTVYMHMRKMKELLKMAEDEGLFDKHQIRGYPWPPYKETPKHYLTLDQVERIANAVYGQKFEDVGMVVVACYFVVECLSGIRFSDWGTFEVETLIKKKRLKIGETQKTKQPIYLQLEKSPRLSRMIQYIHDHGYKFTYTEAFTNRALKTIGKAVGIKIKLTTHVGRHSYATLMLEMGYSKETVGEMLGVSGKTIDTYAKMTRRKIDAEYEKLGGL